MDKRIFEIQEKLKEKLPAKRYIHTVGVMYTCASLAMKYEYDIDKAMMAGLLHDCAKYHDDDTMLKRCEKYNICISETERKMPHLLHGKLGAYYAQSKYGIDDEEILEAIRCHTTGKPGMNKLECILFISDYIEPSRKKIPGLEKVRYCAFNKGLEDAVKMKLICVLDYLEDSSEKDIIDRSTIETLEYYKRLK